MSLLSSSQRRLRVLLCALAAAALALAATAGAASAAPAVTLTHDPDLATNPDVAVAGTGFVSPTPVLAPGEGKIGMYAAQTAVVDGEVVVGDAQQWIRPVAFGGAGNTLLNPDGSFSTELEVDEVFGTAPDEVDCAVVQCYISTWQAHGNPVLDQLFTQSPIYFAPTIAARPAQGIAATGQTIAIDGGGVSAALIAGNGINMAQIAIIDDEVKTGPARWIRASGTGANKLTASGTFSSDLTISSTFTSGGETINCGIEKCKVAFWPGHTNPTVDPPTLPTEGQLIASQDISFAYSPSAIVTPTSNLPETQLVAVSGSGYDPSPAKQGVYVSQVAQVGDSIVFPPPGGGAGMQWVRPGGPTANETLNPDGSFATAVTVARTFKDSKGATVDCLVVRCSVITWRAHTNPSSATIYTSAPLSFSAPINPPPPATPPSATVSQRGQFKLGTKAKKLTFATVRCGSATCQFQKPKRVALKIGKTKVWLKVTGPNNAAADKVAKFGVQVSGKAAKLLSGRKGRVVFKIQARSDAGAQTIKVNKLLVGASK